MPKHLDRDLQRLKKDILGMGAMIEDTIRKAITALVDRRVELAQEVLDGDDRIDEREIVIEEECLKLLALHQPVAADLRHIIAIMKVNNDLERVGDEAVNIAERVVFLASHPAIAVPLDFRRMVEVAEGMLRESLDALVNLDTALARRIIGEDDEVDRINAGMFAVLQELMERDPSAIQRAVHTLSVSRHLERIADLATNIAEDVVFMVEGEVIRHRYEDFRGPRADA